MEWKTMKAIKDIVRTEAFGGVLLVLAVVLAMMAENSFLDIYYKSLLSIPVAIQFGEFEIAKPLLLWINDGLMAIFFFLIGLEIKREVLVGELSEFSKIVLPVIAAVGGMAIPALIYAFINWDNDVAMRGWAIPSATDIAFALGVMNLLGKQVPNSLKLFLMTLAIVDDLGAIVIIALFYTTDLSELSLIIAALAIACLFLFNRIGVLSLSAYILVGLVLWSAVLKSGVHATLAGVLTAFFVPFRKEPGQAYTQLERLEHDLHPVVMYVILPLFAFANTGISFNGLSMASLFHPVPLGIAAGLFLGNQIGVFSFSWLAIKLKFAQLPKQATWLQLYGVATLCGIGFTMSLFISSLAFDQDTPGFAVDDRLGILVGSLLSALVGYGVLRFSAARQQSSA
jgi:NhaA family Na+:H+ antiporter